MTNFDLSKLTEGKNPQSVFRGNKRIKEQMGTNWTS